MLSNVHNNTIFKYQIVGLVIEFGAIDIKLKKEKPIYGIAHFIEHLLSKELSNSLIQIGVNVLEHNASTGYNRISLTWIVNKIVDINELSYILNHLKFSCIAVCNEREIIRQEYELYKNHKVSKMYREKLTKVFSDKVFSYDIVGDLESISNIDSDLINDMFMKILNSRKYMIYTETLFRNDKRKCLFCNSAIQSNILSSTMYSDSILRSYFPKEVGSILILCQNRSNDVGYYTMYELVFELILLSIQQELKLHARRFRNRIIDKNVISFIKLRSTANLSKNDVSKIPQTAIDLLYCEDVRRCILNKIIINQRKYVSSYDYILKSYSENILLNINLDKYSLYEVADFERHISVKLIEETIRLVHLVF